MAPVRGRFTLCPRRGRWRRLGGGGRCLLLNTQAGRREQDRHRNRWRVVLHTKAAQIEAPTHCYGNGEEGHAHHDADECCAANICGAIGSLQRRHRCTAVRKSGCRDIGADGDQWRRCGRRWRHSRPWRRFSFALAGGPRQGRRNALMFCTPLSALADDGPLHLDGLRLSASP